MARHVRFPLPFLQSLVTSDAALRSAAFLYFVLMMWIVVKRLREQRPLVYYMLAGILFILAQLAYFLLSRTICNGTNAKIDGSFLATVLETATVTMLYLAWQGITEGLSMSRRVCRPMCSSTVRRQTTGTRIYTSNRWRRLFYDMIDDVAFTSRYR